MHSSPSSSLTDRPRWNASTNRHQPQRRGRSTSPSASSHSPSPHRRRQPLIDFQQSSQLQSQHLTTSSLPNCTLELAQLKSDYAALQNELISAEQRSRILESRLETTRDQFFRAEAVAQEKTAALSKLESRLSIASSTPLLKRAQSASLQLVNSKLKARIQDEEKQTEELRKELVEVKEKNVVLERVLMVRAREIVDEQENNDETQQQRPTRRHRSSHHDDIHATLSFDSDTDSLGNPEPRPQPPSPHDSVGKKQQSTAAAAFSSANRFSVSADSPHTTTAVASLLQRISRLELALHSATSTSSRNTTTIKELQSSLQVARREAEDQRAVVQLKEQEIGRLLSSLKESERGQGMSEKSFSHMSIENTSLREKILKLEEEKRGMNEQLTEQQKRLNALTNERTTHRQLRVQLQQELDSCFSLNKKLMSELNSSAQKNAVMKTVKLKEKMRVQSEIGREYNELLAKKSDEIKQSEQLYASRLQHKDHDFHTLKQHYQQMFTMKSEEGKMMEKYYHELLKKYEEDMEIARSEFNEARGEEEQRFNDLVRQYDRLLEEYEKVVHEKQEDEIVMKEKQEEMAVLKEEIRRCEKEMERKEKEEKVATEETIATFESDFKSSHPLPTVTLRETLAPTPSVHQASMRSTPALTVERSSQTSPMRYSTGIQTEGLEVNSPAATYTSSSIRRQSSSIERDSHSRSMRARQHHTQEHNQEDQYDDPPSQSSSPRSKSPVIAQRRPKSSLLRPLPERREHWNDTQYQVQAAPHSTRSRRTTDLAPTVRPSARQSRRATTRLRHREVDRATPQIDPTFSVQSLYRTKAEEEDRQDFSRHSGYPRSTVDEIMSKQRPIILHQLQSTLANEYFILAPTQSDVNERSGRERRSRRTTTSRQNPSASPASSSTMYNAAPTSTASSVPTPSSTSSRTQHTFSPGSTAFDFLQHVITYPDTDEVVYLRQRDSVYDLVVVGEDNAGSRTDDIWRMDVDGLTHTSSVGEVLEHISLLDWAHEHHLYTLLHDMRFARNWRKRKSLIAWRSIVMERKEEQRVRMELMKYQREMEENMMIEQEREKEETRRQEEKQAQERQQMVQLESQQRDEAAAVATATSQATSPTPQSPRRAPQSILSPSPHLPSSLVALQSPTQHATFTQEDFPSLILIQLTADAFLMPFSDSAAASTISSLPLEINRDSGMVQDDGLLVDGDDEVQHGHHNMNASQVPSLASSTDLPAGTGARDVALQLNVTLSSISSLSDDDHPIRQSHSLHGDNSSPLHSSFSLLDLTFTPSASLLSVKGTKHSPSLPSSPVAMKALPPALLESSRFSPFLLSKKKQWGRGRRLPQKNESNIRNR